MFRALMRRWDIPIGNLLSRCGAVSRLLPFDFGVEPPPLRSRKSSDGRGDFFDTHRSLKGRWVG
jgi:hypothetical protein